VTLEITEAVTRSEPIRLTCALIAVRNSIGRCKKTGPQRSCEDFGGCGILAAHSRVEQVDQVGVWSLPPPCSPHIHMFGTCSSLRYFNSSTVIMVQLCQDVWWCDWVSVRQLIAEQTVCYCSVQLFCAWAQPESPWKSSIQSCFWRLIPPVDVSLMAAEMRHWLVLDVKIKSEQVRVSFPESSHGSVFSSNTSRVWNGQVLDILQGTQQNLSGKGWIGTWLYASKIAKSGTLPLQSHWHFLVLAANPSPICCQACPRLASA